MIIKQKAVIARIVQGVLLDIQIVKKLKLKNQQVVKVKTKTLKVTAKENVAGVEVKTEKRIKKGADLGIGIEVGVKIGRKEGEVKVRRERGVEAKIERRNTEVGARKDGAGVVTGVRIDIQGVGAGRGCEAVVLFWVEN